MTELQLRNIQNRKLEQMLVTAKRIYGMGDVPIGKEKRLLELIKGLEDMVYKEF